MLLFTMIASVYCREKKKRIILFFYEVRNALDNKHLPYGYAAWAGPYGNRVATLPIIPYGSLLL